ncbi:MULTISPECIES: ABC transporter substrate-binding protein [Microbacterium]|jgi:multiple sugar transport system substrate-binding protein|uniref:Multiple sugar transport system substrate-binding protein n=1 Tax=Microbacterium paludicola TaxID=300019 RepID=A0ABU1I0J0_9MICO|nr:MULTISPECIES: extracellular solute-binding protein [Microbacterium]MDR6167411.1 multiple sugar transport system substrate-binding protein [Microbacterium paludicola]
MRNLRTPAVAGLGLLAATALLAGCSSGTGAGSDPDGEVAGSIRFQTWSLTPTYAEYLDGVIDAFEEKYPDVTVELLDQPGDGYSEKVLSQASTNTLPDVINLPPDFALPLAKQNLLYDVSTATDLESTYFEGSVDAYRFDGVEGVYGYPWYLGTDVNYWNSTQLDACGLDSANPPQTTDELFAQAATMADACPDNYLISRVPGIGDFTLEGIDILNDDGTEFVFNTPEAAALVDRYAKAYANGEMPPTVLNADYLGNAQLFTQGKVAWTTGGATAIDSFEENNPSLKGNVAISPALNISPLYVQGVSVAAGSENLAAALAFAEFVTNAENQNAFAHIANVFPSTQGSDADPYFTEDDGTPSAKARITGFESLKTAEVLTPYSVNGAMNDYLNQQIALAIRGDISGQEALDKSVEKLNDLLARQ